MSDDWYAMLVDGWEKLGQPSYRHLARMTGLNHEPIRQALNGSGATSHRTIRALADALYSPPDNDILVNAWQRSPSGAPRPRRRADMDVNIGSRRIRELLRDHRIKHEWSQRQVAQWVGVGQPALSELELFDRNHSLDVLSRWAHGLKAEFGIYVVLDGDYIAIRCTPDPSA